MEEWVEGGMVEGTEIDGQMDGLTGELVDR